MTQTSYIYFLIKMYGSGTYIAYGSGISTLSIPDFHMCRIMRYYPGPMIDITQNLVRLQQHWRTYLQWRRWYMNPRHIQERAMYGRWIPMRRNALTLSQ
jgi:hypothetical protein